MVGRSSSCGWTPDRARSSWRRSTSGSGWCSSRSMDGSRPRSGDGAPAGSSTRRRSPGCMPCCWRGMLTDPAGGGPSGPAVWPRDHLDPTLAALTAPQGPFAACHADPGLQDRPHRLLPVPVVDPAPAPPSRADRTRSRPSLLPRVTFPVHWIALLIRALRGRPALAFVPTPCPPVGCGPASRSSRTFRCAGRRPRRLSCLGFPCTPADGCAFRCSRARADGRPGHQPRRRLR